MSRLLDLDAIREAHPLPAVVGAWVKLQRAGQEWKACCPFHDDRSPSFTIYADGRRFQCFGCGAGGDLFDALKLRFGVTIRQAAEMLGKGQFPKIALPPRPAHDEDRNTSIEAERIWRDSVPARGTAAESYLHTRGLTIPIPDALRFARLRYGKRGPEHPVMVALISGRDGSPIGIQRTYLNAAGTGKAAVPKPKLSLGHVRGGAVRLGHGSINGLMLTEGVEDALSLMQMEGRSAWAAAGAGMLPFMRLPPAVQSIVIGADADDAGRDAAKKAMEAFTAQGREVRIIYPLSPAKDFNQELMEANR